MASKKTAAKSAKSAKNSKAKSPSPAKAPPPRKERLAMKVLPGLPPLNEVRRRAYLSAFTQAQCEEWGARTKAVNVLADAEKAVAVVLKAVTAGIDGYPPHRLAWVCSLMIELEDSIEHQVAGAAQGAEARASRNAAVALATRTRIKLAHGLISAAGGDAAKLHQVADRNDSSETPSMLETSITGLLQLAVALRRTPEGEVLADDAGLTEAFLSSASAVADSLNQANQATYGAGHQNDTVETNRIEGRLLRELNYLRTSLNRAKERKEPVPAFPVLGTLKSFVGAKSGGETPAVSPA